MSVSDFTYQVADEVIPQYSTIQLFWKRGNAGFCYHTRVL